MRREPDTGENTGSPGEWREAERRGDHGREGALHTVRSQPAPLLPVHRAPAPRRAATWWGRGLSLPPTRRPHLRLCLGVPRLSTSPFTGPLAQKRSRQNVTRPVLVARWEWRGLRECAQTRGSSVEIQARRGENTPESCHPGCRQPQSTDSKPATDGGLQQRLRAAGRTWGPRPQSHRHA